MHSDSPVLTESTTPSQVLRKAGAVISGGLGVLLLCLGLASSVLVGFVSSPGAAKKTTIRVVEQPAVQDYLVDEIVNELEDKANPIERLVLVFARSKIVSALHEVVEKPEIQNLVGDVAAEAYSVYVDNEAATEIDISPISSAVVEAVVGTDKRLRIAENLELDPITVTRNDNDFDFGGLRDSVQRGSWLLIVLGVLLQVAAWFLAVASPARKLQRLGIRTGIFGAVFVAATLVLGSQILGMAEDEVAVVESLVGIVTSPLLSRFAALTVLGIVVAGAGFFMQRKENASTVS
jgi:hypothetical protein